MTATMTTPDLTAHLWLWQPNRARWLACGTGTDNEMATAHNAAVQAAMALGLGVIYRVAATTPAPLHTARRVTIALPEPSATGRTGSVWLGPDYVVDINSRGGMTIEAPPFAAADSPGEQAAWRVFALAVLAATQPPTGGVS